MEVYCTIKKKMKDHFLTHPWLNNPPQKKKKERKKQKQNKKKNSLLV